jgi:hypothetical protein
VGEMVAPGGASSANASMKAMMRGAYLLRQSFVVVVLMKDSLV